MKKKISLFIILFLFPCFIYASYNGVVKTTSTVRVRKGPGTSYDTLYSLGNGVSITVVDKTKYTGTGCSDGWYKIIYKEKTGYMCSSYVSIIENSYEGINTVDYTARVTGNNVAVRKGPSTDYAKIESLSLGVNVTILSETNGWYKIKYYGASTGYISKSYVKRKSEITATDEEYSKTLTDFPESYIPYLTYLHQKHPNWQFVAKKTNINFSTAVYSEEGINYMQTTNNNYRTSTKPAEGSSWYRVNNGVIAFYMDPRNWLTEERIFMFEQLGYSSALEDNYLSLVKSVFGSGALGDEKYTIPMVVAGKENKISPVHIASRISLEVGVNGSDSTNGGEFTFKGKTYSGYYNFFNIGAYEQTIDGVKYNAVQRGLLYAAKLINRSGQVWDNIQTAISEGSAFLANGYINKGQGTLYYQKFNVSPDAYYSKYAHQYQTNIQAPATEGNKTYNAYKSKGNIDNVFIFEIPVYNNMPSVTSLPNSGDTNNNLSSIKITNYSLTPTFDKDILDYEVYIPLSISKINITATAASNVATVDYENEIEIKDEETIVTIVVTSQSGIEKKYTLTIKQVDDTTIVNDVITASSLTINNNVLSKIKNKTKISVLKNTLIKNGAQNIIVKKGNTVVDENSNISTGMSITITTALETKTYSVSVNGDTSGDGNIDVKDLLQVRKYIVGTKKLTTEALIAADTSGDGKVDIKDLLQIQKHITGTKKL